ncbi:hypothetical protein DFS33DRAFT_1273880 [Desarmillaria ectypa]|nr:hypothetical protein DFS33DRAFT_1273880 [Desarmillaria ectypa]
MSRFCDGSDTAPLDGIPLQDIIEMLRIYHRCQGDDGVPSLTTGQASYVRTETVVNLLHPYSTAVPCPDSTLLSLPQLLPWTELRNMLDVSRVFYEIALNVRYEKVTIEGIDSPTVVLLKRLRQVAKRVLHLSIVPHDTRTHLIDDVQIFRFANFGRRKNLSIESNTKLLIDVPLEFRNFNGLSIDIWGLPSSHKLLPFLNAVWSTFGKQIPTLFLSGYLDALRIIVETSVPLESLESLRIQLIATTYPVADSGESIGSVLALRKFINGPSPQLKTFDLWSWTATDASS